MLGADLILFTVHVSGWADESVLKTSVEHFNFFKKLIHTILKGCMFVHPHRAAANPPQSSMRRDIIIMHVIVQT